MILVTVNSVFMYTRHFCNVINNYLSAFYCQTRHECVQSTTNKSALEWYCKHALLNLLRTRGHYNRDIRKIGFRYFGFLTRPQGETNIVYFQLRSLTQFFYKGHFSLLSHPECKSRDSYSRNFDFS